MTIKKVNLYYLMSICAETVDRKEFISIMHAVLLTKNEMFSSEYCSPDEFH